MPHLQRALRMRDQLSQAAAQRRVSVDTLDRCDTAALLVAADGLIIYANRNAEALLVDGKAICYRNGKLTGIRDSENDRLSTLILDAARMGEPRHLTAQWLCGV